MESLVLFALAPPLEDQCAAGWRVRSVRGASCSAIRAGRGDGQVIAGLASLGPWPDRACRPSRMTSFELGLESAILDGVAVAREMRVGSQSGAKNARDLRVHRRQRFVEI